MPLGHVSSILSTTPAEPSPKRTRLAFSTFCNAMGKPSWRSGGRLISGRNKEAAGIVWARFCETADDGLVSQFCNNAAQDNDETIGDKARRQLQPEGQS